LMPGERKPNVFERWEAEAHGKICTLT
jgi:hypothetical protein